MGDDDEGDFKGEEKLDKRGEISKEREDETKTVNVMHGNSGKPMMKNRATCTCTGSIHDIYGI